MATPKVFVTRLMNQEALDFIGQETEMEVWSDEFPPPAEVLLTKAADVEGILTNVMDRVNSELLDAGPRLKVVSQVAVGVDNIDLAAATARGIPVGNTPGVLSGATADLAFALIMSAARRVVEANRWVRAGNWRLAFHPNFWLGADLAGATLGIVGMGKIGLEVAKRAAGFDMEVLYHSRTQKMEAEQLLKMDYVDLSTLLKRSDFVSLHVPLTPETRHLIGKVELETMKPTAILINVARGPVVDPAALYTALVEGGIAGAALDVTEPEPIPHDDPLLTLDNLVITPHIGSAGMESRRNMCMLAAKNMLAGLKGERLVHCVNPEVYG